MLKRFLPLIIFVVLSVFLGIGLTLNPRLVPSPFIDKPVPAFALPTLAAPEQAFGSDDLRGEVALLNVWASWCVACRSEHPLLNGLARQGVLPIYGLNYKDERDDALQWLARFGDPYTLSVQDYKGKVGIDLGVYGVPETFLVDAGGIIRAKYVGPLTEEIISEDLLPRIRQLKAGQ